MRLFTIQDERGIAARLGNVTTLKTRCRTPPNRPCQWPVACGRRAPPWMSCRKVWCAASARVGFHSCWCSCMALWPSPTCRRGVCEAPGIVERGRVRSPAAENDHHAVRTARVAHARTVLDPLARAIAAALQPWPREGCTFYVQTPHVIHWFTASVAAEYQQVWFRIHDDVPLPPPRGWTNNRYYHPGCFIVTIPQVKQVQVVWGQWAAARSPALNHHLQQFKCTGGVCCPGWRCHAYCL